MIMWTVVFILFCMAMVIGYLYSDISVEAEEDGLTITLDRLSKNKINRCKSMGVGK